MGGKRVTTESYMEDVIGIHVGKYEYREDWEYTGSTCKIDAKCKWHGWFTTTAVSHRNMKSGCPECAKDKQARLKMAAEMRREYKRHLGRDKQVVDYINKNCPSHFESLMECYPKDCYIKMVCKKHGTVSWRKDLRATKKQWCLECIKEETSTKTSDWIKLFRDVHQDFYSYDKLPPDYFSCRGGKVTVTCPVHGDFKVMPNNHRNGIGCKSCGQIRTSESLRRSWAEDIQDALPSHVILTPHHEIYGYTRVEMMCPDHGHYDDYPIRVIQGRGCGGCAREGGATGGYKRDMTGSLYYLKINSPDGIFYKIGITNKENVLDRFPRFVHPMITILKEDRFLDGKVAATKELEVLREHGDNALDSEPAWWGGGGYTEMFREDILRLDK